MEGYLLTPTVVAAQRLKSVIACSPVCWMDVAARGQFLLSRIIA